MSTPQAPLPPGQIFPSVDDAIPGEEGGSASRTGFNYQDEIAVCFFIEALSDDKLLKIHCETHDDLLLVRQLAKCREAEYVQVKGGEIDKLWSIADLCRRDDNKVGSSIFETSLSKDKYKESSRFRIVTLRSVMNELEALSYKFGAPGRAPDGPKMVALKAEIDHRCAGAKSAKGNESDFWLSRCLWDVRHTLESIAKANLVALLKLASLEHKMLLPEQAEVLLEELRVWAKEAGAEKWASGKDKKIILRTQLRKWWEKRTAELISGASVSGGGKLGEKLRDAGADEAMIEMAQEIRRKYAINIRKSHYLPTEIDQIQDSVKSELISLRAKFGAGMLNLTEAEFLAVCISKMDEIGAMQSKSPGDRKAFAKGCMFDITDRCLHKFTKPSR